MLHLFRFLNADPDDFPAGCDRLLLALLDAGGTLNEAAALEIGGSRAIDDAFRLGYTDIVADRWNGVTLTKRGRRAALRIKQRGPR